MLKLAGMLGRKLVLPDPPCTSPWIPKADIPFLDGNVVRAPCMLPRACKRSSSTPTAPPAIL